MNLKKYISAAMALMMLAGCSSPTSSPTAAPDPTDAPAPMDSAQNVTAEAFRLSSVAAEPVSAANIYENEDAKAVIAQIREFSYELYSKLPADKNNTVVSPASVYIALACVMNGSTGAAAEEIESVLIPDGLDRQRFNEALGAILTAIAPNATPPSAEEKLYGVDPDKTLVIEIATLLCSGEGESVKTEFAELCKRFAKADTATANFADPASTEAINAWAKDATHGLIDRLFSEPIDPQTVLLLANSIYFAGQWSWEFNKKDTAPGVFHSAAGDFDVNYMLHNGYMDYAETEKYQAVRLHFSGRAYMDFYLPKEGVSTDEVRDSLTGQPAEFARLKGRLLLPKFETACDAPLVDTLRSMGMGAMFSGGLTEMVAPSEKAPGGELFVSRVFQKAKISVDEEGVVAAAVTVMMMAGSSMPPNNVPFEMVMDRPFIYEIYAYGAGDPLLLFMGETGEPTRA